MLFTRSDFRSVCWVSRYPLLEKTWAVPGVPGSVHAHSVQQFFVRFGRRPHVFPNLFFFSVCLLRAFGKSLGAARNRCAVEFSQCFLNHDVGASPARVYLFALFFLVLVAMPQLSLCALRGFLLSWVLCMFHGTTKLHRLSFLPMLVF